MFTMITNGLIDLQAEGSDHRKILSNLVNCVVDLKQSIDKLKERYNG